MSQFLASNMKITVITAGADFASTDDPRLFVNGAIASTNGLLSLPATSGTQLSFINGNNLSTFDKTRASFVFNNSANFKTFDRDVFGDFMWLYRICYAV